MGWKLVSQLNDRVYYLSVGKQITIGRRDCDIIINSDSSVSRSHVALSVQHPSGHIKNPEKLPILKVVDLKSKYGTSVNGTQIPERGADLKSEDFLLLGQATCKFRVVYEPMVVSASCLDGTEKSSLVSLIKELGGHFVSEWSAACTHLVMNEVKVTVKAACAMIALKPLVTVHYFVDYLEKIQQNNQPPDTKNYIPKLGETALTQDNISFNINPNRQKVFQNKKFLFVLGDQYKKMKMLLSMGGADAKLIDKLDLTKYKEKMIEPNVCVIKSAAPITSTEVDSPFAKIESFLKEHNKRLIPESDIGLAVVHCSTECFCNPDFEMGNSMVNTVKLHSQSLTQNEILASETASNFSEVLTGRHSILSRRSNTTIPETLQTNQSFAVPSTSSSVKVEPSVTQNQSKLSRNKRNRVETQAAGDKHSTKSLRSDVVAPVKTLETDVSIHIKKEQASAVLSETIDKTIPETTEPLPSTNVDLNDITQALSPSIFKNDFDSDSEDEVPASKKQRVNDEVPETPLQVIPEPDVPTTRVDLTNNTLPLSPSVFKNDFDSDTEEEVPAPKKQKVQEIIDSPPETINNSKTRLRKSKGDALDKTVPELKKRKVDKDNDHNDDFEVPETASNAVKEAINDKITKTQARKKEKQLAEEAPIPGFLSKSRVDHDIANRKKLDDDTGEPIQANLLGVQLVSLVKRKPVVNKVTVTISVSGSPIKNFKTFKKTSHVGANRLPRIIGKEDLKPFTYNCKRNDPDAIDAWPEHRDQQRPNQAVAVAPPVEDDTDDWI